MTPPATAAARRAAARVPARTASVPARRPVRRPPRSTPPPGPLPARLVPLAVGGTAAMVSGIADTGLFVRLTRGRLWIGLLAVLLAGIVAINVFALSFGASASRLGQDADGLQRANSALRARLAGKLSDQRVQAAAIRAGLIVPEPGAVRYLRWRPGDARAAARRLAAGDIANAPPAQPSTGTTPTATTTTPPAAATTTTVPAPTATQPAATAPTATTPTTVGTTTATAGTTATTTTPTAAATGGVAAP